MQRIDQFGLEVTMQKNICFCEKKPTYFVVGIVVVVLCVMVSIVASCSGNHGNEFHPGELYKVDPLVGNLRFVPAGTFIQGSTIDEQCRFSTPPPIQFTHTLTRNLAVMETEVTRQMWADLKTVQPTLPADPTNTSYSPGMLNPVQNVSWNEAVFFANVLSMQRGLVPCYYMDVSYTDPVTVTNYESENMYCDFSASGYRLPSEGEWEYAARAGTTTPFSCEETNYDSGNCESCEVGIHPTLEQYAVYCVNDRDRSEPAGSKLANPWNLRDMHGNVWEWCWDWCDVYPYPGSFTDYVGPSSGFYRTIRGGSWSKSADWCRSAFRSRTGPSATMASLGFRLVRSLNQSGNTP